MAPPTLLPPSLEGWPVDGQPRPRRGARPGRRRLPAAHAARAHDRGAGALLREYTAVFGLTPERADRAEARRRPDHAPGSDEPGRRDRRRGGRPAQRGRHRPGAQRRAGAHGRAVPAARVGQRGVRRRPVDPSSGHGRRPDATAGRTSRPCRDRGHQGRRRRRPRRRARSPTSAIDGGSHPGRRAPTSTCPPAHWCSTPAAASWRPRLVDLHTHLRQPGREDAETIESGSRAAVLGRLHRRGGHAQHRAGHRLRRGGRLGARRGRRGALCDVEPSAAITVGPARRGAGPHGRAGRAPASASSPTTAPACRTTGSCAGPWSTPAASAGSPWPSTARSTALAAGGHMHEGEWSSRLGMPGIPAEAEELMVSRDLALARLTGCPHPLPAPVHRRLGRAGAGGQGGRAGRSPPRPPPTTSP